MGDVKRVGSERKALRVFLIELYIIYSSLQIKKYWNRRFTNMKRADMCAEICVYASNYGTAFLRACMHVIHLKD